MSRPVHILYATMTGNAEYCAENTAKAVRTLGLEPRITNVTDLDPATLGQDPLLLVCASTYGEGDPPPDAEGFYESLQAVAEGAMANTRYALFALGDTNYDDFCGFGKKLETEFQRLGAQPLLPRADADVTYDPAFDQWLKDVCAELPKQAALSA